MPSRARQITLCSAVVLSLSSEGLAAQAASDSIRPPARSGFGLAFDSRRSRLVVFGGSDTAFQRLGDTWEWSAGRWTRIDIAGPPARSDFAMTFDSRRGRVVVFGGRTTSGLARDTWEFDGTRWVLADTAGPSARALTSLAYDEARGRVVLFGGSTGASRLADTWEWDGKSWIERVTTNRPGARGAHALVYDASLRRTVLIGGYAEDALADSWEWDGTSWTRRVDGPDLLHTGAAFNPVSRTVLVFGGFHNDARSRELWARTSTAWTSIPGEGPPARAEHRGVYIPDIGFVIFGGIGGQGMSVEERGRAKLNDLWSFGAGKWLRLTP